MPKLMSESRKKAMQRMLKQAGPQFTEKEAQRILMQELKEESDEVNDPRSRKYEGDDDVEPDDVRQSREDRENPMIQEGRKRANEPTGAWRKRQGLGKPEWFESEY